MVCLQFSDILEIFAFSCIEMWVSCVNISSEISETAIVIKFTTGIESCCTLLKKKINCFKSDVAVFWSVI